MKQLHIFRRGLHRDMSGQTIAFSESDLAATAAAYNPELSEAPIVIGHPQTDAPAYGWVAALHGGLDGLKATTRQINPAFADAELVEQGAYKKLSAAFYAPDAPNNPVKGVYYLKHVGVLGAVPPEVKGLKAISFSEHEDGIVEFSEGNNTLADSLRQTFTALAGNVSFAEQATRTWAASVDTHPLLADAEARGKKS